MLLAVRTPPSLLWPTTSLLLAFYDFIIGTGIITTTRLLASILSPLKLYNMLAHEIAKFSVRACFYFPNTHIHPHCVTLCFNAHHQNKLNKYRKKIQTYQHNTFNFSLKQTHNLNAPRNNVHAHTNIIRMKLKLELERGDG